MKSDLFLNLLVVWYSRISTHLNSAVPDKVFWNHCVRSVLTFIPQPRPPLLMHIFLFQTFLWVRGLWFLRAGLTSKTRKMGALSPLASSVSLSPCPATRPPRCAQQADVAISGTCRIDKLWCNACIKTTAPEETQSISQHDKWVSAELATYLMTVFSAFMGFSWFFL